MTFVGTLLPYQPEAVERMISRKRLIIAYDMGLGKTVITIAAIDRMMDDGVILEPGLIIALSSLKYQWAEQITTFTGGSSSPLVIDGPPKKRAEQYCRAYDWESTGYDYIILNYEQVVNDWEQVRRLPRGFVVLDEATAIKSFRSKRSKHVKKLADAPVRFALTGTPMENGKPEEVFSIMQFVDRPVLGNPRDFDARYVVRNPWGGVSRYRSLEDLHARLRPVLVRKRQTDQDVAPWLPRAAHKPPVRVSWDRPGAEIYRHIAADLREDLCEAASLGLGRTWDIDTHYGVGASRGDGSDLRGRIGAKVTALRMLCSDPRLLRHAKGEYADHLQSLLIWHKIEKAGHNKLKALTQYVTDFLERDERNKVVIFAHYVEMTHMIYESTSRFLPEVYTGKLNARQKNEVKIRFRNNPNTRILISSDAGGYGVDLPEANLLINYDLPDTSGAMVQRNARINRASSQWPTITIQDFVMKDSIEERQLTVIGQKSSVQSAVIDGASDGLLSVENLSKFLATSEV